MPNPVMKSARRPAVIAVAKFFNQLERRRDRAFGLTCRCAVHSVIVITLFIGAFKLVTRSGYLHKTAIKAASFVRVSCVVHGTDDRYSGLILPKKGGIKVY